jgi:hypothetical protein
MLGSVQRFWKRNGYPNGSNIGVLFFRQLKHIKQNYNPSDSTQSVCDVINGCTPPKTNYLLAFQMLQTMNSGTCCDSCTTCVPKLLTYFQFSPITESVAGVKRFDVSPGLALDESDRC